MDSAKRQALLDEANAIVERVWRGRYRLRKLAVDPSLKKVEIVVPEETFAMLAAAHRALRPYGGPVDMPIVPGQPKMRMFGIPVTVSKDLEPGDVRFRSEVAL